MVAPFLTSLSFDRKNYHNHLSHFHHQHVSNSGYHVRSEDELSAVSVGSLGMGGGSSHGGGHGGGGGGHTSSPRQRRRRSSRTSVGSAAAAVQGKLLIQYSSYIAYSHPSPAAVRLFTHSKAATTLGPSIGSRRIQKSNF